MDTINGLPVHPLLVHVVVVLVPLTALMAIAVVVWPAARPRLGILVPLMALATLIAIPLTTSAGEALEKKIPHSDAVEHHAELGETMIYWMGPLFALTVIWWALHNERIAAAAASRAPVLSGDGGRWIGIVLGVAIVVVAIGSVVTVILIGESGARAVWGPPTDTAR
ncbi:MULTISPECIES: DUF2231 domain-containing protein [unclassified Gordonia (in: high G+C Gram-positive bacteria)]|uniref:DUF2231 domain-containing protein n=1 Tax=unclassified Gordonia (in: high G+C Gram-positive bacteria) TaxID=2657482 RepID=UPI001F1118F3|nr:DUF2231 domain-containing protein [Gordonia sp. ABSL49_1]MCH5644757.1 hypothetical protein [Gordonia sp. ABSL49_1]